MNMIPGISLKVGVEMPQLGFGVFQVPANETAVAVGAALDSGYTSVDTAAAYGNESAVGAAVVDAAVSRDDVFVTTKLWNDSQGYDATLRAFDASLDKLGMEYVDLYLIHWPAPARDRYVETWKALEQLEADGRARAIGVSNFQIPHLLRLFDETDVVPAVNQVELHPNFSQRDLRAFHAEHGIATEAWSPLGQGSGLLDNPTLRMLADKYGKTPAQVVLRWHLQLGNIVIPKSVTPHRIRENIEVFDFEVADDDMDAVGSLDTGQRVGPDPDVLEA